MIYGPNVGTGLFLLFLLYAGIVIGAVFCLVAVGTAFDSTVRRQARIAAIVSMFASGIGGIAFGLLVESNTFSRDQAFIFLAIILGLLGISALVLLFVSCPKKKDGEK
jgi:hypothetical protein